MINNRRAQLEMRWIPVTDARGRTRMEMVWIAPADSAGISHAA